MPTTNLSGRALAEAAAKVMGWTWNPRVDPAVFGFEAHPHWEINYGKIDGLWSPEDCAADDYLCLAWARGNCDYTIIIKMTNYLHGLWSKRCYERESRTENWSACTAYLPGDYARALVAAAGEGER